MSIDCWAIKKTVSGIDFWYTGKSFSSYFVNYYPFFSEAEAKAKLEELNDKLASVVQISAGA